MYVDLVTCELTQRQNVNDTHASPTGTADSCETCSRRERFVSTILLVCARAGSTDNPRAPRPGLARGRARRFVAARTSTHELRLCEFLFSCNPDLQMPPFIKPVGLMRFEMAVLVIHV